MVEALYSVRVTRDTFYDVADRWLQSDWIGKGQYLVLDLNGTMPAPTGRLAPDDPLPRSPAMPAAGIVQAERQSGDSYEADILTTRPSYALFKMTWHPDWAAYVNGVRQQTRMLTPGFVGVPVGAGKVHLLMRYEPERWKAFLAVLGPLLAGLFWFGEPEKITGARNMLYPSACLYLTKSRTPCFRPPGDAAGRSLPVCWFSRCPCALL